jgi:hypothetical protein
MFILYFWRNFDFICLCLKANFIYLEILEPFHLCSSKDWLIIIHFLWGHFRLKFKEIYILLKNKKGKKKLNFFLEDKKKKKKIKFIL